MRDVDESLDLVDEVLPPGVLEEVYMLGLQPPKEPADQNGRYW